ncbi:uncharacterized protein LOC143251856 [Tachypleus tridentatus]|uniref:uncharacterized protein LOC143251856 n=1 Tax=Tachypleus tridentatus TaxID=6853 RepID=UPI003FD29654
MLKLTLFTLLCIGSSAIPSSRYVNFKPDGSYSFQYTLGNPVFHQHRMEYGAPVGSPEQSSSNSYFGYSITDEKNSATTSLVNTDEKVDKELEKVDHSKDSQQLLITNTKDEKENNAKTNNEDEKIQNYAQATKYVDTNDQNERDSELTAFFPTIPYGRRRLSVQPTINGNNRNINFRILNPGYYNPINSPLTTDDKVRPLRYVPQNPFSYWPQYYNYIWRETGGNGKLSEAKPETFAFQDGFFQNPAFVKDKTSTEGKESNFQLILVQHFPHEQLSFAEKDNTQVKATETKTRTSDNQHIPFPGSSVEIAPNRHLISPVHYSPFPLFWFVGRQAPVREPYEDNKEEGTTSIKDVQESLQNSKPVAEVVKTKETALTSEDSDSLKDGKDETSISQNSSSYFQKFLNSYKTFTSETIPEAAKQVPFHHYVPYVYHHYPSSTAFLSPFIIPTNNIKTKTSSW